MRFKDTAWIFVAAALVLSACGGGNSGGGSAALPATQQAPAVGPSTSPTNSASPTPPANNAAPGVLTNPIPAPTASTNIGPAVLPTISPAPSATPTALPTPTAAPSPGASPIHLSNISCPQSFIGGASNVTYYRFVSQPSGSATPVALVPAAQSGGTGIADFGCTAELTVTGSGSNGVLLVWVAAGLAFLENGKGPFGPLGDGTTQNVFCCSTVPHTFTVNNGQSLLFAVNARYQTGSTTTIVPLNSDGPAPTACAPSGCTGYAGVYEDSPLPTTVEPAYAPGTSLNFP